MALVYNSPSDATANVAFINGEFAADPPRKVDLEPGKVLYINASLRTQDVNGCGGFNCDGSSAGYPDGDPVGNHDGRVAIVQMTADTPSLILSGAGFVCTDPILWLGNGTAAAIEVEGRESVATGWHRFQNQLFREWLYGVRARNGYYDENNSYVFVENENHGERGKMIDCVFTNVGSVWRCENGQAVHWVFDTCTGTYHSPAINGELIACDLVRGGYITFRNFHAVHPMFTAVKLGEFSPHTCRVLFDEMNQDRVLSAGTYIRLVDGTDAEDGTAPGPFWNLTFTGYLLPNPTDGYYDNIFYNCDGLNKRDWDWRGLRGLPAPYSYGHSTVSIFIDPDRIWSFRTARQTTAPNYVYASIGDVVRCAFDFSEPMPTDVSIDSITSITVANIVGATEPTIGTPEISYDKKKAEIEVTCTSATANTYTLTATVITTDAQTLVRKGRLVVQ